jgi:hypothetical protein
LPYAADNPKVFKLGFMTSLSGTFAAHAETQKRAVLLAVDEINARGGLNMPWGIVTFPRSMGSIDSPAQTLSVQPQSVQH